MSEMRLQQALARAGVASRRAAEDFIRAGQVRVDGMVAELGSKVDPSSQSITVKGKRVTIVPRRWLAFHKPLGVVTTASDEQGRRTVFDFLTNTKGLTYVGRLDVMTTGLLLLTTDGEAVHRLTHPRYRISRRYTALVHGRPTAEVVNAVKQPVLVERRPVVPTQVRVRPGHDGRSIVDLTLAEGRHHIVRRWAEALGLKIERLARLSYGPIRLGDLKPGESRILTNKEMDDLYRVINLTPGAEPATKPKRR